MVGSYSIDDKGRANLSASNLRMEVPDRGQGPGLHVAFGGTFVGKPPKVVTTLTKALEEAKKEVRTIEKMVGTQKVTLALGNVDPVRFQATNLAMGPVGTYPAATVDGELDLLVRDRQLVPAVHHPGHRRQAGQVTPVA